MKIKKVSNLYFVLSFHLIIVLVVLVCSGCASDRFISLPYSAKQQVTIQKLKKDKFKVENIMIQQKESEVVLSKEEFKKLVKNVQNLNNSYIFLYNRAQSIIQGLKKDIEILGGECIEI